MSQSLPSHFIDLVRDALLNSFWSKPTFRQFQSRHGVNYSFLATISSEETKRETLDRLFPKLEKTDGGRLAFKEMREHQPVSREDIDKLLLDKLPKVLTLAQKLTKIHNLLSSQAGKTIRNAGSRSGSQWVLMGQENNGKQTR